ncbi:MAG TPA: divalent metal cation transporter [Chitinophagaceae bacterium]|nr:divalent metal cation transporter [Chitinophagaceae bacterium]
MANKKQEPVAKEKNKNFLEALGPGLITGASDDDPSGIATYSQAGAKFGMQLLWTAVVTYPMMAAIQEMCARIGIVTCHGLTGVIKRYYSRTVLYIIVAVSLPSIILNIGADIAGMGAVGNLVFPKIPAFVFSVVFTALLMYSIIFWSYTKISKVLKWLCIVLLCYLIIPFIANTDWLQVLKNTILPKFENSQDYFMMLVAILGTTISPYLFFWQTSMEVEEMMEKKLVVDKRIMHDMHTDIKGGMVFTNIVFFFVVLTSGTVLYNAGTHEINTIDDAAKALQPLLGNASYILFSIGVIGTGLLAIPVLAGAASYMMAEAFDWQEGLNKKFHEAKGFYITVIASLLTGLSIQIFDVSPVKALLYAAVLYGLTAPVLIAIILHICNNKNIMGDYANRKLSNILGVITLLVMVAAAVMMLWYMI